MDLREGFGGDVLHRRRGFRVRRGGRAEDRQGPRAPGCHAVQRSVTQGWRDECRDTIS